MTLSSRMVGVILVVSILIALAGALYQFNRLRVAEANFDASSKELAKLEQQIKNSHVGLVGDHISAIPQTKEEDTLFLQGVKKDALETGVQIEKWVSTTKPAGTGDPAAGGSPIAQPQELRGLYAIDSDLDVFGPYDSVRAFVQRLENSKRLLNLDRVSWHRGRETGTRLFLRVTRYVYAPGTEPGMEPPDGSPTNQTGGNQ